MSEQKKSLTPITDAEVWTAFNQSGNPQYVVRAEISRQIETQNAALVAALENCQTTLARLADYVARDRRASSAAFAQDALLARNEARAALAQAKQL